MTHSPFDPLPEHLTQHGSDPKLLGRELIDFITRSIVDHPRSQQVQIGPSEIGTPCPRKIGYKLLNQPEKKGTPNWKATMGTYAHSGLEDVMNDVNERLVAAGGEPRFITEQSVVAGVIGVQLLGGHTDLYDRVTNTVVDWKTVGKTQLKKYKTSGPGDQYRVQGHAYGRGWKLRGFPVQRVAVMFLPRDGELREAYFWSEDFDEQVAIDAISRVNGIQAVVDSLGHDGLELLPTYDNYCGFCPYQKPGSTDLSQGCPGDAASRVTTQTAPPMSLL